MASLSELSSVRSAVTAWPPRASHARLHYAAPPLDRNSYLSCSISSIFRFVWAWVSLWRGAGGAGSCRRVVNHAAPHSTRDRRRRRRLRTSLPTAGLAPRLSRRVYFYFWEVGSPQLSCHKCHMFAKWIDGSKSFSTCRVEGRLKNYFQNDRRTGPREVWICALVYCISVRNVALYNVSFHSWIVYILIYQISLLFL